VADEIRTILSTHGNSSDTMHIQFSAVPLTAWEEEMPVLDAVIKETMRFTMSGTALRRNIGGDVVITNETVRDSDFLAYSLGDIHFDSQVLIR
jgi:cytochrome P450